MSIALVTSVNAVSAGGTSTVTTSAIDTTGSSLLVITSLTANAVPVVVSDSKLNTWHKIIDASNDFYTTIWYAWNPAVGTGHTFSINGFFNTFEVSAWSGILASSDPLDTFNTGSTIGTSIATGSVTPVHDNELIYSEGGTELTQTYGVDSSLSIFDTFGNVVTSDTGAVAYLIQTSATAINPTWTATSSSRFTAGIVTFQAAATPINHKKNASMNLVF